MIRLDKRRPNSDQWSWVPFDVNMDSSENTFAKNRRGIATAFLKLGITAYGGPPIMGIMQAELQEKRQWVSTNASSSGWRC